MTIFQFFFFCFFCPFGGLGLILHIVIIIGIYPRKPPLNKFLPYYFSLFIFSVDIFIIWIYNTDITREEIKKMIKVVNKNGCEIDFEAATKHMDARISDKVSVENPFANFQQYFTAYEEAYEKATGEEWFLSGSNPVW